MSHIQSRAEKNEGHLRKPGRSGGSGYHRGFSGGSGGGKAGGGYGPPAPSSTSSHDPSMNPSLSANRSFKKTGSGNGQGGQVRMVPARASSEGGGAPSVPTYRPVQNGTHTQAPSHGAPNVPMISGPQTTDASSTKAPRDLPRPPTSQTSKGASDSMAPPPPAKGEAQGAFTLQFGTISPGVVNGIQIPARTSSAPPNLDEQKRDQVARDSFVSVPPREQHQLQKKEVIGPSQPSTGPSQHPPVAKRESSFQIPATTSMAAAKPSIPIPGMSMPMFQQPQGPVQFGGHNPQIHSQNIAPGPLSMSMVPMPLGPTHPMFVAANLQSHAMHQGQGLNFAAPMGHQLGPQMGNMGMGIGTQYSQPHGNFGAPRKSAVKITHPETHEELKLGQTTGTYMDPSGQRSHANMSGKSQQIPSFNPAHQTGYFQTNSYTPASIYSAPSSAPLVSTQTAGPQVQRYNFPFGQSGHPASIVNPPVRNSSAITKSGNLVQSTPEPPNSESGDTLPVTATLAPIEVTLKNISLGKDEMKLVDTHGEAASTNKQKISKVDSENSVHQNKSITEPPSSFTSLTGTVAPLQRTESGTYSSASATSALDSGVVSSSTDGGKNELIERVDSVKVNQKKISKEDNKLTGQEQQVGTSDSTSGSKLPSPVVDYGITSEAAASDFQEDQAVPVLLDSSTDSRNHEAVHDFSVASSTLSILTTDDAVPREPELTETVATHGLKNLTVGSNLEATCLKQDDSTQLEVELKCKELKEIEKAQVSDDSSIGISNAKIHPVSSVTESSDNVKQTKISQEGMSAPENATFCESNDVVMDHTSVNEETISCMSAASDSFVSKGGKMISQEVDVADTEALLKGDTVPASISSSSSTAKDQHFPEMALAKTGSGKKKKKKELLSKADAAGTNSDLYMAYKGPDEKHEAKITLESPDGCSAVNANQVPEDECKKLVAAMEKERLCKAELDDWEDAADMSTPNLKMSNGSRQRHGSQKLDDEFESGSMSKKKYSRDFLLTFSAQCTDLPADFEIGSDLANALMSVRVDVSFSSHVRIIDRPSGPNRVDRHNISALDDEKWTKSNSFPSVRDPRMDGHGPGGSFRQGPNNGVLRGRGGILSGPGQMQPVAHGVISRNNIDSERWQRAPGSQRGLIPSPHMPAQIMHKAEKKYEVGKVSDEEESKQRQIKAILNKLTPQNFERLFEKVKEEVDIDSAATLRGVISQIFDKALMEPTFCEMYADFCLHLSGALPDFSEKNEKITFKRLLLNKCQEEFERGEREEAEAGKAEEEGELKQTPQEREGKRVNARRRMLGNIRLIGELYKMKMLTERIMHECIKKLLGQYQKPDEEDIESLCKLMSTIGDMIDHSKAKVHMDTYFDVMKKLSTNQTLSSRVRFMLKDVIDLRKNNWQQRRKIEGPKKIEEVHRDAAQERQVQTSRSARGSGIISSTRRGPPADYGHRSSASLISQGSQQMGGFRAFPPQARGFGMQDVRMDDRHPVENRMLSVPLPQRPIHDDAITLGPQGGLARGMSSRGQPLMPNAPLADNSPNTGEARRTASGPNGPSSASAWTPNSSREEVMSRTSSDRFSSAPYDYSSPHQRTPYLGNRDFRKADFPDRHVLSTHPQDHVQVSSTGNDNAVLVTMSEERLREKSTSTIREYYSAEDIKEVVLCIEELNSPSFYPSMVSLWVTDSFERKDAERDLLAKLLISLSKSQHSILSQAQLIQGFELVLLSLEDAVNDAPRAAEFLGRIFAKIVLENVISFSEVGRLIREAGEEPGCLVEIGLASDVLGSILEIIKAEEGDALLDQIRSSSNLRLEDFQPPHSTKSRKLDAFL